MAAKEIEGVIGTQRERKEARKEKKGVKITSWSVYCLVIFRSGVEIRGFTRKESDTTVSQKVNVNGAHEGFPSITKQVFSVFLIK